MALIKKPSAIAVDILILGAGAWYYHHNQQTPKDEEPRFRTAAVDKGTITQTVPASGTLNPVGLIKVGLQESGTVLERKADFSDRVKQGHALLRLDPTIFNAQLKQGEASLASAESSKRPAQATLEVVVGAGAMIIACGFTRLVGIFFWILSGAPRIASAACGLSAL